MTRTLLWGCMVVGGAIGAAFGLHQWATAVNGAFFGGVALLLHWLFNGDAA